jgi:predicted transport protein
VKEQVEWSELQIQERGEKLAAKAINIWSALDVDSKLVAEYELRDRQARSTQYDIESVLGKRNVKLYDALQETVLAMGDDITPIVSKKNVTFYTLSGFLQVVPRSGYLGLIMAVEQEELDPELAQEVDPTHHWNYIRHGNLSGVYSWVANGEHIQEVLPIIQQAYEQALS